MCLVSPNRPRFRLARSRCHLASVTYISLQRSCATNHRHNLTNRIVTNFSPPSSHQVSPLHSLHSRDVAPLFVVSLRQDCEITLLSPFRVAPNLAFYLLKSCAAFVSRPKKAARYTRRTTPLICVTPVSRDTSSSFASRLAHHWPIVSPNHEPSIQITPNRNDILSLTLSRSLGRVAAATCVSPHRNHCPMILSHHTLSSHCLGPRHRIRLVSLGRAHDDNSSYHTDLPVWCHLLKSRAIGRVSSTKPHCRPPPTSNANHTSVRIFLPSSSYYKPSLVSRLTRSRRFSHHTKVLLP
jgi:hypothetical protein